MLKLQKLLLFVLIVSSLVFQNQSLVIPITGNNTEAVSKPENASLLKSVDVFSKSLKTGLSSQIMGVFVENTFAFPVTQQPSGNAGYVSTLKDTVTQFSMATQYGSIGLLAHNDLAGAQFSDLKKGDKVILVYGDGSQKIYEISEILQYQALSPNSPYSNFVNLDAPKSILSATSVFLNIYNPDDRLIFQTCIAKDGVDSWGRLFVVAEPVEKFALNN